ncbi:MAG: acyltransferase family protein [Burkholderiaceae bacterium]
MDKPATVRRTAELDVIKGVMIVLMVFGHVTYCGSARALMLQVSDVMHTFRIPLFLVICGFFFSPLRPARQLARRAVRGLLLPYLLFEMVYIALLLGAQFVGFETNNHIKPTLFNLADGLFWDPIGAYWFLHTLGVFQLTTALSVWLARKCRREQIWMALLVAILLIEVKTELLAINSVEFLLLGVFLKQYRVDLPGSIALGALIIAAVGYAYGPPLDIPEHQPNVMIHMFWVVAIMSVIIGVFRRFPHAPTLSLWRFLGQNTLIMLLMHPFFINLVKPFDDPIIALERSGIVYALLATALGVAGPIAAAFVMDRLKLSPLLFDRPKLFVGWREAQGRTAAPASSIATSIATSIASPIAEPAVAPIATVASAPPEAALRDPSLPLRGEPG